VVEMSKALKFSKVVKHRRLTGAQQIMAGMRELEAALKSGKPLREVLTVREVTIAEPGAYDAKKVKQTRERLGVSQAVFAELVGVSKELVEHWEQGISQPRAVARRLLDLINRDPKRFMETLTAHAA